MKSLLLLLLLLLSIMILLVQSSSSPLVEWELLTKLNFSSQIRLHPHLLLLVTLPWSGEARSLMNDLSHSLQSSNYRHNQQFQSVKLRLLHSNTDKLLSHSLGASTDHLTVFYFHHSFSYKYNGRIHADSILSSLFRYLLLPPHQLPLEPLHTPLDFTTFLRSTDKAFVLVDFCGWTPKLLLQQRNNNNDTNNGTQESGGFAMHGDFSEGNEGILLSNSRGKINQKVAEDGMCKADTNFNKQFCKAPWLGEFTSENDGEFSSSCSFEEFERFHSFYLKFMTVAREFFLPPERHRFGLVSNRSMLSSLGVGDPGLWFGVHYLAGCSSCSTILKKEDDLNYVLQMNGYYVKELEGNGHDQEPILPANKPSVLLFVDRTSDSLATRGESKEALDVFRVFAQHHHVPNQTGKNYRGLKRTSEHPRLILPMTDETIELKEKLSSIMIINGDKKVSLDNVPSDLQASSLNKILGYLLQKKKDQKLSSLAKDLGFQLLSDDIDIRSANTLKVQLNQISTETAQERHTNTVKLGDDPDSYAGELEENPNLSELSSQHDEGKTASIVTSEEINSLHSEESVTDHKPSIAKDMESESGGSSDGNKSGGEKAPFLDFNGSFFYSDGNYQLLKRLTGGYRVPSLVIVDPFQQQHYVYPEDKFFNYSSLYGFISEFLNGTLLPYQQSEHILQGQREATHPPFVNLDFHEVDSIPRITAHTFSELVIGFNLSSKENISNAWNKDVLVLFSNSWCAFCQRMEIVVREVYRAIKGYMDTLKNGSRNLKGISDHENLDNIIKKLPLIHLLDCTLNDCDLILKSVDQREVYPALILFPAGKKQPILYEGDISVVDIMKFVAEHGSNFHHLIREKVAVLWRSEGAIRVQNGETLNAHSKYAHDWMREQVAKPNQMTSPVSKGMHETMPRVVIGSVLIATEKLAGTQPFEGSMILIVAADQITGFQGLIINKHIRWSSLPELEQGFEKLKESPLSLGGPVVKSGMPLLSLTRTISRNSLPEIVPGIYFLDHVVTISKIEELKSKSANEAVGGDYWFFLGYSSWGWKQLYDEMAEGAWSLSEDGTRHLKWP